MRNVWQLDAFEHIGGVPPKPGSKCQLPTVCHSEPPAPWGGSLLATIHTSASRLLNLSSICGLLLLWPATWATCIMLYVFCEWLAAGRTLRLAHGSVRNTRNYNLVLRRAPCPEPGQHLSVHR